MTVDLVDCAIDETLDLLCEALREHRFPQTDEKEMQDHIAALFCRIGLPFEREVSLSRKDRIDFLCGPIGLEIKIGGSLSEVTRQLHRYAQSEQVSALVLVTTKNLHRAIPPRLNGKQVRVMWTGFQGAF